jgi:hypothetical protein
LQLSEVRASKELFSNNFIRPTTRQGHTIERRGFGGQPVKLTLDVLYDHIQNVIHDLTHREAILDVNRLTQDPLVRDAIISVAGRPLYRTIRPWLQAVAGDYQRSDFGFLAKLLNYARSGTTIMAMGLKATTSLAQLGGFAQSISVLGEGLVGKGILRTLDSGNPAHIRRQLDFIFERDEQMRNRRSNFDREARDLLRGLPTDGFAGSFSEWWMYSIGLMDMTVAAPTWMGAYRKGMTDFKGDERKAIEYAGRIVRQTQGSGLVKDLAQIQRGGPALRLMTQFYTFFAAQYGLFWRNYKQLRTGQIGVAEFSYSMFYVWVISALAGEMLSFRGPEEDEPWLAWAARNLAEYPFMAVIGLRDAARFVADRLQEKPWSFEPLPVIDAFGTPLEAITAGVQDAFDGELRRSTVRKAVQSVGYWGHLPSQQLWITSEAVWDAVHGEDLTWYDFLFARPRERRVPP